MPAMPALAAAPAVLSPVVTPAAAPGLLAVSTIELTLRMGVALVLITSFLVGATRFTKRHLHNRGQDRPQIDIRHQRQLSKQATVTLLTAGSRNLLIAHTASSTTLLAEGDDLVAAPTAADGPSSETSIDIRTPEPAGRGSRKARANPIRQLQNKTVRRG